MKEAKSDRSPPVLSGKLKEMFENSDTWPEDYMPPRGIDPGWEDCFYFLSIMTDIPKDYARVVASRLRNGELRDKSIANVLHRYLSKDD